MRYKSGFAFSFPKLLANPIFFIPLALITIGIFFTASASSNDAINFNDQNFFLRRQIIWTFISVILFVIAAKINIDLVFRHSIWFYLITLVLLLATLIPALNYSALGASRWLKIGPLTLQPSEVAKLTTIILFSRLLSDKKYHRLSLIVPYFLPIVIFLLLQPNFSTVVLLSALVLGLFYQSGGNLAHIFSISLVGFLLGLVLIFSSSYRLNRWQQLFSANTTNNYHSQQLLIGIKRGQLFGVGLGNSEQKFRFIPKIATDSLLAVIIEETGVLGLSLIFGLLTILVNYLYRLARICDQSHLSLFLGAIALWIGIQALINTGAITAIVPLTGVPFPFISYGGSSLSILMIALGLAANIQKNHCLKTKS